MTSVLVAAGVVAWCGVLVFSLLWALEGEGVL